LRSSLEKSANHLTNSQHINRVLARSIVQLCGLCGGKHQDRMGSGARGRGQDGIHHPWAASTCTCICISRVVRLEGICIIIVTSSGLSCLFATIENAGRQIRVRGGPYPSDCCLIGACTDGLTRGMLSLLPCIALYYPPPYIPDRSALPRETDKHTRIRADEHCTSKRQHCSCVVDH
jgi:hypothetical protein